MYDLLLSGPRIALLRRSSRVSRLLHPELCSTIIPISGGRYYHIVLLYGPRHISMRVQLQSSRKSQVCMHALQLCIHEFIILDHSHASRSSASHQKVYHEILFLDVTLFLIILSCCQFSGTELRYFPGLNFCIYNRILDSSQFVQK